ncbi:Dolichol kinase EVAN [Citrus sinensis]|nr:dolichol kinase EVAN isoform X1 [Citrus sinensis]KAH9660585.1 Dolichol kinase EVAN [Citrus sinensis]
MALSSSMLNGERGVVVLIVCRVLYSLPLSLLCPGLNLAILSLFALFLDIRLDDSAALSRFKTRPGASSGILLGAVTLPTVMISKLIQLTRAYSLQQIELQELEHMTMQYWATSASCFGVLIFLCLVVLSTPNTKRFPRSFSVWDATLSIFCVASYAVTCCVSLAAISHTGSNTVLKLMWELYHGLVAVMLIQRLLDKFPSCASIGELLLVTVGLVLYFGDMLACTIAKVSGSLISTELVYIKYGIRRSEISIIIQGVVLGLLLFPLLLKYALHLSEGYFNKRYSEARRSNEIRTSLLFFSSLGFILVVIIPSWMQIVQDFHVHPLLWVLTFVFSEPLKRLSLCIYWVSLIFASVLRFYNISKNSKIERILLRKYYHLLAVLMFVPALIFQPKFLHLAFGAALAVFLVLEIMRVWRIWPLGQLIHQFMTAFTDHRDSDLLIVSHFSLLLGCALPIWMSSGFNDRPLAPFAGILSLGIGDTMASIVGYKYGVLRWSKTGKKTIEGTAAGITSVLAACSILLPLLASTGYIFTEHWFSLILAVTVSSLLEAYTTQLDNAFIPLIFYSHLCL